VGSYFGKLTEMPVYDPETFEKPTCVESMCRALHERRHIQAAIRCTAARLCADRESFRAPAGSSSS